MAWLEKSKVLSCKAFMKGNRKKYNFFRSGSSIFMMVALLWLTISVPFVYASQQKIAAYSKSINAGANDEESSNPFSNTTEEKTPSTSSLSEEYLHDHPETGCFFSVILQSYKCEEHGTYNAFHGELLVPPPNVA